MLQTTSVSAEPTLTCSPMRAVAVAPTAAAFGVYAIDEQPLFRRGLAAMVGADPAYQWLGEASSGAEALAQAHAIRPDLIFIDLPIPGMGGVETLVGLRSLWPQAHFVVMVSQIDPSDLRRVAQTGASCLHKSVPPAELMLALRTAQRGQRVLSPVVAAALGSGACVAVLRDGLTPRELALLRLMGQGLDNRGISQRMDISVPTVKFHVTHILSKLSAPNRTAAVLAALREKIISLDEPAAAVRAEG